MKLLKNWTTKWTAGVLVCLAVSGCEVPVMMAADANDAKMSGVFEISFPAVLLVQVEGHGEEFLAGEMKGYANGNAKFDLTGPNYGQCVGDYKTSSQLLNLSCDNGVIVQQKVEEPTMKMSGVNVAHSVQDGQAILAVFGWGNDANEAAVRKAIES